VLRVSDAYKFQKSLSVTPELVSICQAEALERISSKDSTTSNNFGSNISEEGSTRSRILFLSLQLVENTQSHPGTSQLPKIATALGLQLKYIESLQKRADAGNAAGSSRPTTQRHDNLPPSSSPRSLVWRAHSTRPPQSALVRTSYLQTGDLDSQAGKCLLITVCLPSTGFFTARRPILKTSKPVRQRVHCILLATRVAVRRTPSSKYRIAFEESGMACFVPATAQPG